MKDNVINIAPRYKWSHEVLSNKELRAATFSPLMLWYFEEDGKRKKGIENEIDINEIKHAMQGGINRWSERVNRNKPLFARYLDKHKLATWDEVCKA